MVEQTEILVFEIYGEASASAPSSMGEPPQQARSTSELERRKKREIEKTKLLLLNSDADEIADEIQREVRKVLLNQFTVQAEVGFSQGSIILSGTIILISWAGPIIAEAAKKELSEIVGVAVRRVIGRVFNVHDVNWEPKGLTVQERNRRHYSSARAIPQPLPSSVWLWIVVGILTVIVATLVVDRLFMLRPEVAAAIQQGSTSSAPK